MFLRDMLYQIGDVVEGLAALNAAVRQMLELVLTSCVVDVRVERGKRLTNVQRASVTPELDLSSGQPAVAVEVKQKLLQRAVSLRAVEALVHEIVPRLDFVLAEPGNIDLAVF